MRLLLVDALNWKLRTSRDLEHIEQHECNDSEQKKSFHLPRETVKQQCVCQVGYSVM